MAIPDPQLGEQIMTAARVPGGKLLSLLAGT